MTTSFARLFLTTIPPVATVEDGETYGFLNSLTGTLIVGSPPVGNGDNFPELFGGVFATESQTLDGVVYGALGNDRTGNVILPLVSEVELAVAFGPNGSLIGTLEGGSPTPPPADMCNVSVFVRKHVGGDAFAGVIIEARHPSGLAIKGSAVSLNSSVTGTTNEAGFVLLVLSRQAKYRLSFKGKEGTTFSVDITVPNTESATIEQAL
jgi:hypothetical protein